LPSRAFQPSTPGAGRGRRRTAVFTLALLALCTAGLIGSVAGASAATSKWNIYGLEFFSKESTLTPESVSCPAEKTCLTAGWTRSGPEGYPQGAVVQRWNGEKWTGESAPWEASWSSAALYDVSCASTTSCTAVGRAMISGAEVPVVYRWNGFTWSLVSGVGLVGVEDNLKTVSCSGTTCLALGTFNSGAPPAKLWAAVYNGTSWTAQNLSTLGGTPTDVSCLSATYCIVVGKAGTTSWSLLWNGTKFETKKLPAVSETSESVLESVSCKTAAPGNGCQAVGYAKSSKTGNRVPLAMRWNGTEWTLQAAVNPEGSNSTSLTDVSCNNWYICWAVGNYIDKNNAGLGSRPFAERIEYAPVGTGVWQADVPKSNGYLGNETLLGVSCWSTLKCNSVGTYTGAKMPGFEEKAALPMSETVIRE
jgi:hypothetical protein